MKVLSNFWRKLTDSQALAEAGPLEKMFLEKVYRLAFITGLSFSDHGVRYNIYRAFIYIMSFLFMLFEIWHILADALTLDEKISVVNTMIIKIITYWKIINMLVNKAIFKQIAKSMDLSYLDPTKIQRRQAVEYWHKNHNIYFTLLLYVANGTLIFWFLFPLIDDLEYNLMIGTHMPFQYNTTLRYIFTYLFMAVMFNIEGYHIVMTDVILQAYLMSLISQYAVLAVCFENVFEDCATQFEGIYEEELIYNKQFREKYKKHLGSLVDQHLMILNQTKDLKGILSAPLLGQLCSSGMLICTTGYQLITMVSEDPGHLITIVGYLSYHMYTLYLVCRWCEEITCQSQNVGEAAYLSGWEGGMSIVPGVKATIMIIMSRANKPLIFVAGGMYNICISSYTDLVKASYSALNILLRMSKE